MMTIQMRIWSEAITASEFCLLFDSHKMAIFNIRLLHIRLCLRPTSAIPCIKFSALAGYTQSLLIISPVTRCVATWPLQLEVKLFLSNNVRMSTATEMCTARS